MEKFILLSLLALQIFSVNGQSRLEVGYSFTQLSNLPEDVSLLASGGGFLSYSHTFRLHQRISVESGLHLQGNRYILDGYFSKPNGTDYEFSATPANYKNSNIVNYFARVPALIKYAIWPEKEDGKNCYISVGPYLDYYIISRQSSKVNGTIQKENTPLQGKFHYGLQYELSVSNDGGKKRPYIGIHCGMNWQISPILKEANSFSVIQPYVSISVVPQSIFRKPVGEN